MTSTALKESETSETSETSEYCHGCESGADCPGAHSEECNKARGITSTFPIT